MALTPQYRIKCINKHISINMVTAKNCASNNQCLMLAHRADRPVPCRQTLQAAPQQALHVNNNAIQLGTVIEVDMDEAVCNKFAHLIENEPSVKSVGTRVLLGMLLERFESHSDPTFYIPGRGWGAKLMSGSKAVPPGVLRSSLVRPLPPTLSHITICVVLRSRYLLQFYVSHLSHVTCFPSWSWEDLKLMPPQANVLAVAENAAWMHVNLNGE
eukprot:1372443-Amphidinium_carterae.2